MTDPLDEITINRNESEILDTIDRAEGKFATLLLLWQRREDSEPPWVPTPSVYAQLARKFVESGAPFNGLEVATEGLAFFPGNVALKSVQGLALARSGATEEANRVLKELYDAGNLDDEVVGVLGRTHKDLWLNSNSATRQSHLDLAGRLYSEAYNRDGGYWTGINVATLATLRGERDEARNVAAEVMMQCRTVLRDLPEDDAERYWVLATLGEAALNLEKWDEAEEWYTKAVELGWRRFGDVNSTRHHARLLLKHFNREADVIDDWLPIPRVVVFAGHMPDRSGRQQKRFPAQLEQAVANAIRRWLAEQNALIGFSSAACGSDILFQEALKKLDGERHIVLPYHESEFVPDSVDIVDHGDWKKRFRRVIEDAQLVYASSARFRYGSASYDYANRIMHGLGKVRARRDLVEAELIGLAVWDGVPGDGPGGTANVVAQWHGSRMPVWRVDLSPDGIARSPELRVLPVQSEDVAPIELQDHATTALLFADAVGFSEFTETEVELFANEYLRRIAELVERESHSIVVRETWGDGLFLALTNIRAAGLFALELSELVDRTDWQSLGFRDSIRIRIALHAGPVLMTVDPITGLPKCAGTHVSRAARLEPKTPTGQVYASEAFAALAELENIPEFRCDYVRLLDWAKHYGTFPTYIVKRNSRPLNRS